MSRLGGRQLELVYAVTLLRFTVYALVLVALQRYIAEDLGGSVSMVGIVIGSFTISALVLRPMLGRKIDRHGHRPFLLGALAVLILAAASLAAFRTVPGLVGVRLVQGGAHAAVFVALASLAVQAAPLGRRATAVSRFSLFQYVGLGIGPPMAGWLIAWHGFTAAWLASVVLLTLAVLASLFLEEATVPQPRRAKERSFRLLHRNATKPGILMIFPSVGYGAITSFGAVYAMSIGAAPGLLYAVFSVTIIIIRFGAGDLADRLGARPVVIPGLVLSGVGLCVTGGWATPQGALSGVVLFGLGFSFLFPALFDVAMDASMSSERAEVVASFTAYADLGVGVGAVLTGLVVGFTGFGAAFAVMGLCSVFAAAIAWAMLPRRGRRVPRLNAASGLE
jgi:MFS family permease